MSYENYEQKKSFVTQEMKRCMMAMFPRVSKLEYDFTDRPNGVPIEIVTCRYDCGYTVCVDVTEMDLLHTTLQVIHALAPEEP